MRISMRSFILQKDDTSYACMHVLYVYTCACILLCDQINVSFLCSRTFVSESGQSPRALLAISRIHGEVKNGVPSINPKALDFTS